MPQPDHVSIYELPDPADLDEDEVDALVALEDYDAAETEIAAGLAAAIENQLPYEEAMLRSVRMELAERAGRTPEPAGGCPVPGGAGTRVRPLGRPFLPGGTTSVTGSPPITHPLDSHRIGRSGPASGSSRFREQT